MKAKELEKLIKRVCTYTYNKNVLKYDTTEEEKELSEIIKTLTPEEKVYVKQSVLKAFEEYKKKPSNERKRGII